MPASMRVPDRTSAPGRLRRSWASRAWSRRKGGAGKPGGAKRGIPVAEAIAVNTYNGAWASGEEAIKGSITAGKLADYVVLAADPHTADPEKIKDTQIDRTAG